MSGSWRVELVEWSDARAEEARRIRWRVFVDEQGVPGWLELDIEDAEACHALAFDAKGAAIGTGRLIREDEKCARIGRMAVLAEARGRGIGKGIVQELMAEAGRRGYGEVVLCAQIQVVDFYAAMGFAPEGERYFDAGILHQTMRRRIGK